MAKGKPKTVMWEKYPLYIPKSDYGDEVTVIKLLELAKKEGSKIFPYPLYCHDYMSYVAGVAVAGAHFGDEGKGKIVDILIREYKKRGYKVINLRGQGGGNAGHTVVDEITGTKYDFHYLPSGGLVSDIILLGAGMLLDPIKILEEMKKLPKEQRDKILIDERATFCTLLERKMDGHHENLKSNDSKVGTTRSGVGIAVSYRALRVDIRMAQAKACKDEYELKELFMKIPDVPQYIWQEISEEKGSLDAYMRELYEAIQKLNIVNPSDLIRYTKMHGWAVVVEVSQAYGLDCVFGNEGQKTTSTHTTVVGALADCGLGLGDLPEGAVLVAKAYSSKVGGGSFVTEFDYDDDIEYLIDKKIHDANGECGVTTGRKRKLGWFDTLCVREAVMRNSCRRNLAANCSDQNESGIKLAVNCMDTLGLIPGGKAKICIAYRHKETGEVISYWPYFQSQYEPVYKELKTGWNIKHWKDADEQNLPDEVWEYLGNISYYTGATIGYIGTGGSNADLITISEYGEEKIKAVVLRLWAEQLEEDAKEADKIAELARKKAEEAHSVADKVRAFCE